jgi:hypothetical protein
MDWSWFSNWIGLTPLWIIALVLFGAMTLAAALGRLIHHLGQKRVEDPAAAGEGQEGYVVSAVLGLMALLMGFTFSLAVDRFEARRLLVLDEANAIGTAYLRAQLLPEPHRARMSDLLVRYTENRIALAKAKPEETAPRLAVNDGLLTDIWAATSAAYESIKQLDFSTPYLTSVNELIDLDAARKAARMARVPPAVFVVLFTYLVTTAGVLGYVLRGLRGQLAAVFLLALVDLALMLIVDIDRPTLGGVVESQRSMEMLLDSLKSQPPSVFDRYKTPQN